MNFIEALQESIDEALSVLGKESKQTIYHYLETNYGLTKHEIPYRIDEFSKAIELVFGTAAQMLQTLIMKNLFKKIDQPIKLLGDPENFNFNTYIASTRIANICT